MKAYNLHPVDILSGGDTFACAFIGALAFGKSPEQAFVYDQIMSSFVVEDYGPNRIYSVTREEIENKARKINL